MIHLEPNQVFIPGSFAGFKRWLTKQKRKPAMTKPLAPAHLPKSRSKVDADALLAIIKEAKQIMSAQLAELLQIDPLSAGNRLKTLRQMGLIAQVGTIKRRPAYAIVDNVRPVTRIYKKSRIREQVIEYFQMHETGSNGDIAQALGKKDTSNVGPITIRLLLEGVLTATEASHPVSGKTHRIFRLNKETSNNGRS